MKRSNFKTSGKSISSPKGDNKKLAKLFSPDALISSKMKNEENDAGISSNSSNATKVVPSCFKGTNLQLKVLPGCCPILPPLEPSEEHTVLFKAPITDGECPKPDPDEYTDLWDFDHVQMPCSPEKTCSNSDEEEEEIRWEVIKKSLSKNMKSSHDLVEAILKYNSHHPKDWNFSGLHVFFKKILSGEESAKFFKSTLPAMIRLALSLPQVCTQPIPYLKQQMDHAITLTQKQISCLLCNAFLCTFSIEKLPSKKRQEKKPIKISNFPNINFNKLYMGTKDGITSRKSEKLKCLINYFSRVTTKEPTGTVTFHRQCLKELPNWAGSQKEIKDVALNSDGVIEEDGLGMLQVDFADKFIGGIVLDNGCVQEEIRFVMCPELIISRLFTERLAANEVVLISGAEQYNTYKGYGNSFLWNGDFHDQTPRDSWGQRCTRIVAMDALNFCNTTDQFKLDRIQRELNKAYCGFYDSKIPPENLPAVATGNWGCGVFRGNPHFKFLIQLMAASEAGRDIMYFTFHDDKLQKNLETMYRLILKRKLKVGDIWDLLISYDSEQESAEKKMKTKFYDFACSTLST